MKDQLTTVGPALLGAVLVALLTWWLTEHSQDVAEAAKERAVAEALLGVQSDALLLAVIDLQATARTIHILWESKAERATTARPALGRELVATPVASCLGRMGRGGASRVP